MTNRKLIKSIDVPEDELREWEVWDGKLVNDLEIKHWGDPDHKRGRHWLLNSYVATYVKEGDTVLEIAPGMGHLYSMIKETAHKYLGLDTSQAMIDKFKENFPEADSKDDLYKTCIRYGDAFTLEDEPIADVVLNVDMLMHIPGELKVIEYLIHEMYVKARRLFVFTLRMTVDDADSWCISKEYYDGKLTIRAVKRRDFMEIMNRIMRPQSKLFEREFDDRTTIWRVEI
ncbi:MAG: class I SAM-dependent methyltransferase [Gammaproteobacteria bacterium]|nr:class I SAM-dependent methyltransferase [Gammaproteobacteria bacterium]